MHYDQAKASSGRNRTGRGVTLIRIGCAIMAALLLFGTWAGSVPAAGAEGQSSNPPSEYVTVNAARSAFIYSDEMLLTDADTGVPSADLAKVSVVLASAAYKQSEINMALDAMGFTNIDDYGSYLDIDTMEIYDKGTLSYENKIPSYDKVAYTIATKIWGKYKIYCVPIKGTGKNEEWLSDFHLSDPGENTDYHVGFSRAATPIYSHLTGLINRDSIHTPIVWLTGHSRGAAVANLIAGWLQDSSGATAVSDSHLFCYTFACPAVAKTTVRYTNIHNYNNAGDLIPLLPLESWGYSRYGITHSEELTSLPTFKDNYLSERDRNYLGVAEGDTWTDVLKKLCPTVEDYWLIRPTLDFVAYKALGANRNTSQDEFSEYMENEHGLSRYFSGAISVSRVIMDLMADRLVSLDPIWSAIDMIQRLDFDDEDAEELEGDINETLGDLLDPDISILLKAHEILEDLGTIRKLYGSRSAVISMLLDTNFQPQDAIDNGHDWPTYEIWINSNYCGYRAYAGSDIVDMDTIDALGETTVIGPAAFVDCINLKHMVLPDNLRAVGYNTFQGCSSLATGIEGIGNLVYIGDYAFMSCEAMEGALELNPELQNVGVYAFDGCSGISSLVIPETAAESLHEGAFAACSGLKYVELPFTTEFQESEYSNSVYKSLFIQCSNVEQIVYTAGDPNITVPEDLGENVSHMLPQSSRSALKSVVLDAGIPNLYASMFEQCDNLESITLSTSAEGVTFELPPGLTYIPTELLYGCGQLTGEFSLPEHVTYIGDRAFESCGLTGDLILPEEVTAIGEDAFMGCAGLTGSLTFPECIAETGSGAFYGTGLTGVTFPGGISEVFPDLFSHCDSLQEVFIESGVTAIDSCAFESCQSLRTLDIPDSTVCIGARAFAGCTALQNVSLPISAAMITHNELVGENNVTFAQCANIEQIVYTEGDGTVFLPAGQDVEYTLIELSRNSLRRIVLPETVTSLPANLFHDCAALELVVTPDTPEGISVRLPQGLREIPEMLFQNCGSLSGELALSAALTSIGNKAFYGCDSLSGELTLPAGLTGIGEKAFYNCGGFTGLTIPDSVITLGDGAFYGCDALKRVQMPISAESSVYDGDGLCVFTAYEVEEIEYTPGADTYTPSPAPPDPAAYPGPVMSICPGITTRCPASRCSRSGALSSPKTSIRNCIPICSTAAPPSNRSGRPHQRRA